MLMLVGLIECVCVDDVPISTGSSCAPKRSPVGPVSENNGASKPLFKPDVSVRPPKSLYRLLPVWLNVVPLVSPWGRFWSWKRPPWEKLGACEYA